VNTNTKDLLSNKIFLEQSESGHKMRFGDLFNALEDYFVDTNIDYKKYHPVSDQTGCEVSTWVLCTFAVLKTFNSQPEQKEFLKKYIGKIGELINDTNYIDEYNTIQSITDIFTSWFTHNSTQQLDIPIISENYTNWKYIYSLLRNMWDDFHDDYIILLCIGTLGFTNLIVNQPNRFELLGKYLTNLKLMVQLDNTYCFYDRANYRGYIDF
jgi:hypothetical protein